jgi:outer membrane protein
VIKYIATSLALTGGLLLGQTPNKVGVINLQQAVVGTQEGQAAIAKLQRDHVEPKTKELEAKQTELRELQDKLQRGGNTMSQTMKDDLQRSIDQKTKAFNRDVEDYEFETQEEQRKVISDLSAKMQGVVAQYVQANGFSVVLDTASQGLVWRHDSVDITPAIIEAYDKTHPATSAVKPAASPSKPGAAAPPPAKPPASTPPPPAKPPAPGQTKQN